MQQAVGTGAAIGALGGAALGAAATGNTRGAVTGAVLGAIAGGVTGYYMEKQQQIADDRARFAAYGTDIDRTTGEFNRTTSAARNAQRCYQKEFKALVQLRKRGKVSDAEGRARFAEIVSGMSEANALMAAVDGRIGESLDTYTKAYESDLQKRGVWKEAKGVEAVVKGNKTLVTYEQWADLLQKSFERAYYVPLDASEDQDYDLDPKLVNRRGIYKDVYGSSIDLIINKPRDFIETPSFFGPNRRRKKGDGYEGPKRREDESSHERVSKENPWEILTE